jgi:hypothetical protein
MTNYTFLVEDETGVELTFMVTAESREDAVRIANEELNEEGAGDSIDLGRRIHGAYLYLSPEFRINEGMIVGETPASIATVERALDYLEKQGYHYSGLDREDLWNDEAPGFVKKLETSEGVVYGSLNVDMQYDPNIDNHSFHFNAFLYPGPPVRIADNEGGLRYSVQLRDNQAFTTLSELPIMLGFYESKFDKLIQALREVDLLNGFA